MQEIHFPNGVYMNISNSFVFIVETLSLQKIDPGILSRFNIEYIERALSPLEFIEEYWKKSISIRYESITTLPLITVLWKIYETFIEKNKLIPSNPMIAAITFTRSLEIHLTEIYKSFVINNLEQSSSRGKLKINSQLMTLFKLKEAARKKEIGSISLAFKSKAIIYTIIYAFIASFSQWIPVHQTSKLSDMIKELVSSMSELQSNEISLSHLESNLNEYYYDPYTYEWIKWINIDIRRYSLHFSGQYDPKNLITLSEQIRLSKGVREYFDEHITEFQELSLNNLKQERLSQVLCNPNSLYLYNNQNSNIVI
jgi:hypothetical protein